jgi:hypothetical protein
MMLRTPTLETFSRPFRVRTPIVNHRRGCCVQIPERAPKRIITPERVEESRRMAPWSHRHRVIELPEDVELL